MKNKLLLYALLSTTIVTKLNGIIDSGMVPPEEPVATVQMQTATSAIPQVMLAEYLDRPFFEAAIYGDIPVLDLALDRERANMQNPDGYTALMLAVKHGQARAVERILNTPDIDLNVNNFLGKTALDIAKELDNYLFVDMIEKRMDELRQSSQSFEPRRTLAVEAVWQGAQALPHGPGEQLAPIDDDEGFTR